MSSLMARMRVLEAGACRSQLGFAGASCADAAAQARQGVSRANQARQQIFQLRELDLQLAFARPGAPREDIENELRAIDDLAAHFLFDLPQLRRCELVVEDHDVGVRFSGRHRQRLDFPGTEKRGGVGLGPLLHHAQDDFGAGRLRQPRELFERSFRFLPARAARDQTDERRSLGTGYASSHA
jgi:hypothetical protein